MRNHLTGSVILVLGVATLLIIVSGRAMAQGGPKSDLNGRLEAEKSLRDNERLRRGMEADSEARARTKEERQAVANEAFMRLQVLHNEMMKIVLSSDVPDSRHVTDALAETKQRAIELRANLVLPKPGKDQKKEKSEDARAGDDLKKSLELLCTHIKSFVINLNNSPTNTKAGEQARRELDWLVTVSDEVIENVEKAKRGN